MCSCECRDLMSSTAATMTYSSMLRRGPVALGLLGTATLLMMAMAVGIGSVGIPLDDVVSILLASLGGDSGGAFSQQQELVLLYIRLPRVWLGALIGAAAGVGGGRLPGRVGIPRAGAGRVGLLWG